MGRRLAQASAPGKAILFGEHAVVYGRPAIAVPVTQVQATATIQPAPGGDGLLIVAADLGEHIELASAPEHEPLAAAARLALAHLGAATPDARLTIRSTIPIASGLGSGAAVSTALIRALTTFLGHPLPVAELNDLVFEVEKIHHGTPSGIDNTVITYEQPVYFVKADPPHIERLSVGEPFHLLVADTGVPSPTKRVVAQVRRSWQQNPPRYEALFDQIGEVTEEGREALETRERDRLGALMNENHELLIALGVSSPRLEALVEEAHAAGAWGAKLSGAGQGGNMIALVDEITIDDVAAALRQAGAQRVTRSTVR